jgi:hypothetical protein
MCGVSSMTRLASEMGLTTVETPATAPQRRVRPSMMHASISTVPSAVSTEPLPALKCGQFSSSPAPASHSNPEHCVSEH